MRMKWNVKKTTLLAAVGILASTMGVNTVSAEEMKTVKVCIPNYSSPADTDAVEAAINEILGEKYGVQMDLEFIATGNWAQQTNLMLTSDEVDVLAIYGTPFASFINNGQLLDLTEYWDNADPALKEIWDDSDVLPFTSDGKVYAIPNMRDYGGYLGGIIDADIAAEFGIEDRQTLTWEELDTFLTEAHAKYPDRYGLVPSGGTALISNWTWDGLGDSKFIGVIPNAADEGAGTEVVSLFDAEDFQEFTTWARKWYEDGITMPDILSNTESFRTMIQADKAIAGITSIGPNNTAGCINFYLKSNFAGTDGYQSVSYGINVNSSCPDEAWTVLQACYIDEEIGNLLLNGIEGTHYVVNEDGTASYPEGVDSSNAAYNLMDASWFLPYCANGIPSSVNGPTYFEDLVKQKEEAQKSIAFGFAFDTTNVIDEYAACSNVMDKYYKALMSGVVDLESTIAQAKEELEASGADKVIAEKQAQLDAWLAEQK